MSASATSRVCRAISFSGSSPSLDSSCRVICVEACSQPCRRSASSNSRAFSIATPGGGRERGDQLLVLGGELAAGPLGEVEVAEHAVANAHRHAEEAVHRWMLGREADGATVVGHGPQPDRARVDRQRAEQPLAFGQRADARGGLLVDPDVDELLQPAAGRQHAQCAVARIHQPAGRLDDVAQHDRQGHVADDHLVGGEQPAQPALGRDDVLGPGDELRQQLIEFEPRPVREVVPVALASARPRRFRQMTSTHRVVDRPAIQSASVITSTSLRRRVAGVAGARPTRSSTCGCMDSRSSLRSCSFVLATSITWVSGLAA